jgi:hypothetical protein
MTLVRVSITRGVTEIHGIELVTRMVGRNDVGDESSRSSTLSVAVDEQHVECGVVLLQPL